ncbi:hypothetical protein B4144_0445 [Bacillus atrophaeus]|nr:hypothetical protein B4144_0445 [Bacillus atrophaeus]
MYHSRRWSDRFISSEPLLVSALLFYFMKRAAFFLLKFQEILWFL